MADARRYAADTSVPVERSRSQLEQLLRVHGAQGFATGWDQVQDRIDEGKESAGRFLADVLAPSSFRERLMQRP